MNLAGTLDITLDFGFLADGGEGSREELLQIGRLFFKRIIDPFALAACFHQAGASQVSQVTRDFGLIGFESALEKADADFAFAHQVEEPEAVLVGQGGEEQGVIFH